MILNCGLMKFKVDMELLEAAIASAVGIRLGDKGCPLPQLMAKCMVKRNPMNTDLVIKWNSERLPEGLPLEQVGDGKWKYVGKVLSWDELILNPTLTWYGELYEANGLKGLCEAIPTMRGFMMSKKAMLSEAISSVRAIGVVNNTITRSPKMEILAILAVISNPSKMGYSALYSLQDENSKVSWLFRPSQAHQEYSDLGQAMIDGLVAFGQVGIEGGKFVFAKSSTGEVGKACDLLIDNGVAVVPHEKGKWVTTGATGMVYKTVEYPPLEDGGEPIRITRPHIIIFNPSNKVAKFHRNAPAKASMCEPEEGFSESFLSFEF